MIEQIKSEKITEVAEPFLLKLDIQMFSDDLGGEGDDGGNEVIDENLDNGLDNDPSNGDGEEGGNGQGIANPEQTPPAQDDRTNAAFAQMRREKEAAEQQLKQMDALVAEQYGASHGIHTFAQYQEAVARERQEAERQRLESAGLPDDVIQKLSQVDDIIKRDQEHQESERKRQVDEQINTEFNDIMKEYPDLGLKEINDVFNLPIYQQMHDKIMKGYSLLDAYEVANRAELRTKAIQSGKQSALNQLNSKSHIRGNGGEGADDVDVTSVPEETMSAYRKMFAKELRTGKMKESDFVKHYKKSQKG